MNGKVEDRDAGCAQLVRSNTIDPERADVRLELRVLQPERYLGQLPLTATVVQLTNHQQDPGFHLQITAARAQNSSPQMGFAKSGV